MNTTDDETRRHVTFSINVGRGSLIGGAISVAKAVNDSKAARHQFEEQHHDRAMEDHGLYLAPHKYGLGLSLSPYKRRQGQQRKKNAKETIKMPSGATTNV